jgi:hypothetical protein
MKYTKKNTRKTSSAARRPQASRAPSDGQKLLLNNYFEVALDQGANGNGGVMGYSLDCDPNKMKLKLDTSANAGAISASNGSAAIADETNLSFPKLVKFGDIYRQYKIDYIKVNITTDRECGLDNPVIMLTDKGDRDPITSVASAMTQAHKEAILTEGKRTCAYGWKPSTAQEREYHFVGQDLALSEKNVIKVLQDVEPKVNGVCKHRVSVIAQVTLKDSKGVALN